MKVTSNVLAALVVGATIVGAAGLVPGKAFAADDKNKQTVSKDLAKPLKAAQDALNAKKYSDALAKLKEAESNPKKTPYDEHIINMLSGAAYVGLKDYPNASKALEAQINDGFLPQEEVPPRVKALAQINYQLKNYDKAIEFGNRALKGGYADEEMKTLVGQAYYLKGDWKGTLKFEEDQVNDELKKGQPPKNESLQLLLSACVKLEDQDCTTRALEKLVAYYPKPEYWQQLLYTMFQSSAAQNDRALLQTYRLASEVDVLKRPEDYTEMAQLAIEQGNPGEAQHILEKGFQKNVFADQRSKDKNQRLLESAKKAAATDQAQLPKIEADARKATTGDKDIAVGLAYLGYQQYDKAVDLLSDGLQKGGVKNEAEARLLLGIAQLKAGKKDDAQKTFKAVKGDASLERLANLWSLHAKQA
jgi:outer membrane protein assembly factor BamD (BamD/ComL family)